MSSVNKVILIGRLGQDPEVRHMPSGDTVCNASLATSEVWKDKQTGEKKEATEWHRLSFFGRLAEVAGQYLRKGSLVYVEGQLRTRKWQDKDGQDRYTTEVRVDDMKMLGQRADGAGSGAGNAAPAQTAQRQHQQQKQDGYQRPSGQSFDDDIPF